MTWRRIASIPSFSPMTNRGWGGGQPVPVEERPQRIAIRDLARGDGALVGARDGGHQAGTSTAEAGAGVPPAVAVARAPDPMRAARAAVAAATAAASCDPNGARKTPASVTIAVMRSFGVT